MGLSLYGRHHISGGMGFSPSHSYTPSSASQNLPHDGVPTTPHSRAPIHSSAARHASSERGAPSSRMLTYDSTVPNMVEWPSM